MDFGHRVARRERDLAADDVVRVDECVAGDRRCRTRPYPLAVVSRSEEQIDASVAVDEYIGSLGKWASEAAALRQILLDADLDETVKWRQPCYTHAGKNVALIAPLSDCCALSFVNGVLLADHDARLVAPGVNSQSVRYLPFVSVAEIRADRDVTLRYLAEAKSHIDRGSTVAFASLDELKLPAELVERFADVDGLEGAFRALTSGRQRGLVLHIEGAKQPATRARRVESHIERILAGKGVHDCVCGKSERMPRCDGSHAR